MTNLLAGTSVPMGVSFFYLWMAMTFEAKSKGYQPTEQMLMQPGADEVWAATIATVGEAPPVYQMDGLLVG